MDETPPIDRLVRELNASARRDPGDASRFEEWIVLLREQGGSDLYLVADLPPSIRVHGVVRPLPEPVLEAEEIERSVLRVLPPHAAVHPIPRCRQWWTSPRSRCGGTPVHPRRTLRSA